MDKPPKPPTFTVVPPPGDDTKAEPRRATTDPSSQVLLHSDKASVAVDRSVGTEVPDAGRSTDGPEERRRKTQMSRAAGWTITGVVAAGVLLKSREAAAAGLGTKALVGAAVATAVVLLWPASKSALTSGAAKLVGLGAKAIAGAAVAAAVILLWPVPRPAPTDRSPVPTPSHPPAPSPPVTEDVAVVEDSFVVDSSVALDSPAPSQEIQGLVITASASIHERCPGGGILTAWGSSGDTLTEWDSGGREISAPRPGEPLVLPARSVQGWLAVGMRCLAWPSTPPRESQWVSLIEYLGQSAASGGFSIRRGAEDLSLTTMFCQDTFTPGVVLMVPMTHAEFGRCPARCNPSVNVISPRADTVLLVGSRTTIAWTSACAGAPLRIVGVAGTRELVPVMTTTAPAVGSMELVVPAEWIDATAICFVNARGMRLACTTVHVCAESCALGGVACDSRGRMSRCLPGPCPQWGEPLVCSAGTECFEGNLNESTLVGAGCVQCGQLFQRCCAAGCRSPAVCVSGWCREPEVVESCGNGRCSISAGENCTSCPSDCVCIGPTTCVGDACVACGGEGQACCRGMGCSSPASCVAGVCTVPSGLPASPTIIRVVYQPSHHWNYISWSFASGATTYTVFWQAGPGVVSSSPTLGTTSTMDFAQSGVIAGTVYCYRVRANNALGSSGMSDEQCLTVP